MFIVYLTMGNGLSKLELVMAVMTPIQRRRWRLRLKGKSLREIAKIEGVSFQAIHKSLRLAKKRAKKILLMG